jgi:hypothetical protein
VAWERPAGHVRVSDTVSRASYAPVMNVRTLALIAILLAAAFALSSALVTRNGVGAIEWIVGIAIVVGLLLLAAQKSSRALGRG